MGDEQSPLQERNAVQVAGTGTRTWILEASRLSRAASLAGVGKITGPRSTLFRVDAIRKLKER